MYERRAEAKSSDIIILVEGLWPGVLRSDGFV